MDYVLVKEQRFAHIEDGLLVESVLPAGTIGHVLEIGVSYTALTGDVMTRLVLQIEGSELPHVHYAVNFNPSNRTLCQDCDVEFATIEDWTGQLQCDTCHEDNGDIKGGFRLPEAFEEERFDTHALHLVF